MCVVLCLENEVFVFEGEMPLGKRDVLYRHGPCLFHWHYCNEDEAREWSSYEAWLVCAQFLWQKSAWMKFICSVARLCSISLPKKLLFQRLWQGCQVVHLTDFVMGLIFSVHYTGWYHYHIFAYRRTNIYDNVVYFSVHYTGWYHYPHLCVPSH